MVDATNTYFEAIRHLYSHEVLAAFLETEKGLQLDAISSETELRFFQLKRVADLLLAPYAPAEDIEKQYINFFHPKTN